MVCEFIICDLIEGVLVVIGYDVLFQLMGYIDDRGQVILSGLGFWGMLDVMVAKEGFSVVLVMDFDVINVMLFLDFM